MSTATYADFDLLIDRSPLRTGYRARVIQSPAGEAVIDFDLPFSKDELADFLWRMGGGSSHRGMALADVSPPLDPRAFGTRFYAAIFVGPVGLCLRRSLDEATRRGVGLRIRLRLDAGVLDLAELPWEFLFVSDLGRFLALSDLTPIVRYLEVDRPVQPLRARLPLTALVIVSNPTDVMPLATEREWQNLQDALAPLIQRGVIVLERLAAATLPALQERLRRGRIDLLHFVGHGFFDRQSNTGGLIFENERGLAEVATAETLGTLLHDQQALRLIFLNACQGAQVGRSDLFAGVAQRLVQQGAPAVLAMQFPVSDEAAAALAQTFYQALADGLPADTALSQARKAIAARGNAQEWATPVLFSRSDDNRLFDLLDVLPPPACPYPGMVPFRAEDARFFYGREEEIERVLRHLRHQRLLFVIGPSGSGKSSLLAAGVLPRLASTLYFPPSYWLVCTLRPGGHPLEALAAALSGDVSQPAAAIAHLLAANAPAQRLLLVLDQFEEIFSLAETDQRQKFIALLQALRGVEQCALVAAMRADFYRDLMNSDLWPVDASQRLDIAALRGDALRRAIRQPAHQAEVEIEDALLERLMADAAGEPGALPMLQETLQLLWARMIRRRITLEHYEQLGDGQRSGLAVAIATKADATLADLTPNEQSIALRIFLRLIQFGQGRTDTRRQLLETELHSASDDPVAFQRVLKRLADNRLVTLSGGEGGAERLVDLSHERLITEWPQFTDWVKQYKGAEQIRRRLEAQAQKWVRSGRGEDGLLDKTELAEASAWLASPGAVALGASSDLLVLVETSRRAINPGWHRWGTAGLLLGAVSLAALVAWIYLSLATSNLQGIGRVTTILFLVSLGILLALAAWQAMRSGPYMLQRLSQTVATRRPLQAVIGLFLVGTISLWVGFGIQTLRLTAECARQVYDWTSDLTGIAIIAEGIDAKEADVFKLAFQNAVDRPLGMTVTDRLTAQKCQGLFRYRITLNSKKDVNGQESIYTASVVPSPPGKNSLVRIGAGCGEVFALAQETAVALDYSNMLADTCQVSGPTSCEPWHLNEEAYALYRNEQYTEAESKFRGIVERYPDFAWAYHNLGMAQMAGCGDLTQASSNLRAAVTLAKGTCGWFWYDLALACRSADDYSCALEAAQKAISTDPGFANGNGYNVLAVILREIGRLDESANLLDEYEKRLTGRPSADQQIALDKNRGILAFERGQLAEALQHLEKADQSVKWSKLSRSVPERQLLSYEKEIVFYIARIHEEQGDNTNACDDWRRYTALPQGCVSREAERRDYATNQLSSVVCRQP